MQALKNFLTTGGTLAIIGILAFIGNKFLPNNMSFVVDNFGGVTKEEYIRLQEEYNKRIEKIENNGKGSRVDSGQIESAIESKVKELLTTIEIPAGPQGPQGERGSPGVPGISSDELQKVLRRLDALEKKLGSFTTEQLDEAALARNINSSAEVGGFKIVQKKPYADSCRAIIPIEIYNGNNKDSEFCINNDFKLIVGDGIEITGDERRKISIAGQNYKSNSCATIPSGVTVKGIFSGYECDHARKVVFFRYSCGSNCELLVRDSKL